VIEKLRDNNIYVTYMYMPLEVWGVLFVNKYQEYHIAVNDRLSCNIQKKVLEHEFEHITEDVPRFGRIIGVDMQCISFEKENKGCSFKKLIDSL